MLKLVCDRCETTRPVKIDAVVDSNPYANAMQGGSANAFIVLDHWKEVNGKHLCPVCVQALNKFLENPVANLEALRR